MIVDTFAQTASCLVNSHPGGSVPVVELASVSKRFGDVEALSEVSFTVPEGQFVAIIGPSGCGKSTILNLVSGLLEPDAGAVCYRGSRVSGVNVDAGYMTQSDTLLPWRTVAKNVAVPLEIKRVPKQLRRARVLSILEDVGLTGFEEHYPRQLSGGMRKRVQLARTLVYEPETLLMDEPFGGLDPLLKAVIQEQLLALWDEHHRTVVYVTHDLGEAISLADRVLVFSRRPARLILDQPIDLPRPRDLSRLQGSDAYGALYDRLWRALREELL